MEWGGGKGDLSGRVRRWNGEVGHTLGARGNFNTIRFPKERIGCRVVSMLMDGRVLRVLLSLGLDRKTLHLDRD
ncbi:hypothetical protein KY285_008240 [Solanum tuberosum]|nr:hypothetical protein KY289_008673 [Solanum tuberosum]KAH0715325.1 hypothetical protein KY284_008230 [Solanum tuberosum]KAH0746583.1 hypothetical protein KY285_008240 [Solanum tuberosum]